MRGISVRKGVVILPRSIVAASERDVRINDTDLLVIYPDDTKGSELDEIVRASAGLVDAVRGRPREEASNDGTADGN